MAQYLARRLALAIPTLLGVSLLVMGMVRLLPGDAVDVIAAQNELQGAPQVYRELVDARLAPAGIDPGTATSQQRAEQDRSLVDDQLLREGRDPSTATAAERQAAKNALASQAHRDAIRRQIGLDRSYLAQWANWLRDAAHLDLGESIAGGPSVNSQLRERIPVSLELGSIAMAASLLIALPAGVISALKKDTWLDYGTRSVAISMMAMPSFLLATIVVMLSSRWFDYSFPFVYSRPWDDLFANLELVLVPGIILGIGTSGTILRLTRAQMLEVLTQDYIRTARAKGLGSNALVIRHGLRNAMMPIVTIIGLQVPVLIGGSIVLESIFGIPGVAQYLLTSINSREFPAIIAMNMLAAAAIVAANLVVDVSYAFLDPRVHIS